jgi:hypothetical protein
MSRNISCAFVFTLASIFASCRTTEPAQVNSTVSETNSGNSLKLCAAVRGNGHYILSHFGALGRITENFGVLDAMAGGSSASVTMFLYESILMNPLVKDAPADIRQQRAALLLKSALGYLEAVKESPEANSVRLLFDVLTRAKQQGLLELNPTDYIATARALNELLSNSNVVELINPKILRILVNADNMKPLQWQRQLSEVQLAASSILAFKADNQKIFFREGVINFSGFASAIGRIGDFYSGSAPVDLGEMEKFLNACGQVSQGKEWTQFAEAQISGGSCGDQFRRLVGDFRLAIKSGKNPDKPRIEQDIGQMLPTIVSTAVIADKRALKQYEDGRKRYLAGRDPNLNIDFDSVKFGYFLPSSLEKKIVDQHIALNSKDAKDRKFYSLGSGRKWRDALETSPAEPGLSPGVLLKTGEISIGGWSDLAPVQILEYAGCDKILYLTRRGEESDFLVSINDDGRSGRRLGVAEQLNLKPIQRSTIYDLDNPASAFSRAILKAEGVWCTNWNGFTDTQIDEMYQESFNAELVSQDPQLLQRQDRARIAQARIRGCSTLE